MGYNTTTGRVFVTFRTEREAVAYARGRLESYFRCTYGEAPDSILVRSAKHLQWMQVTLRLKITAKLGNLEVQCYTCIDVGHKRRFVVVSPELDYYPGA